MFKVSSIYAHKKLKNLLIYVHSYVYKNGEYSLNVLWLAKQSKKLLSTKLDQLKITKSQFSEWKHFNDET